jgi:hypothetical protein
VIDRINSARSERMATNAIRRKGRVAVPRTAKPHSIKDMAKGFELRGVDPETTEPIIRARGRSREIKGRRDESTTRMLEARSQSRSRSRSRTVRPESVGLRDASQVMEARKTMKRAQRRNNEYAKKGEGDRVIVDLKPKHLYSGKRPGHGTTDRR